MSEAVSSLEPCPECGSKRVVPIAYGLPGPDLEREALAGKVRLGGCVITGDDPAQACQDCGHEW